MPEEQRFFYICMKNKYTASGAKRGRGEMEMVLSLTFLPDASVVPCLVVEVGQSKH